MDFWEGMGYDGYSIMRSFPISLWYHSSLRWLERVLGLAVILAIVVYGVYSIEVLVGLDWRLAETFYEVLNRVLVLIIGIELVRMLVSHELRAVLELLAFVIARKMLFPDLESADILMGAIAFTLLMLVYRFVFQGQVQESPSSIPRRS